MSAPPSPQLYPVPRPGPGQLALMAAPRRGPALEQDVAALTAAGVTDVVCLLPDAELAALGLAGEPDLLARNGFVVHRLPVPDFWVPAAAAASQLADELCGRLREGASVVVHCRGGVGRSSTMAAVVLVREGLKPDDAWQLLASARGRQVPETRVQQAFVADLAGAPLPPPGVRARLAAAGLRVLAAGLRVVVMLTSGTANALRRSRKRYLS
jgi:protein-tyrosine phosphatase